MEKSEWIDFNTRFRDFNMFNKTISYSLEKEEKRNEENVKHQRRKR